MTRPDYPRWRNANPLRVWRIAHEQSMTAVASTIGVSHISVANWESGSSTPNEINMAKLAKLVGPGFAEAWEKWERRMACK